MRGWRSQSVAANPIAEGKKNVPTTTAKQLVATTQLCRSVLLRAGLDNSGLVYIGSSLISASGPGLEAGQVVVFEGPTIQSVDLNKIYCIASASGQTLDWWALG